MGAFAAACLQTGAASALTWNWSFTTTNGYVGSGTFTTDSQTPIAFTSEAVKSITGTIADGATIYTITGLDTGLNEFQWNGSYDAGNSPILTDGGGIYFVSEPTSGPSFVTNIFNDYTGSFAAANEINYTQFYLNDPDSIASSSLIPQYTPSSVPGPLPLLGAGAAFGWSRRMRRRLKTSA